jgi:hypothetical protein
MNRKSWKYEILYRQLTEAKKNLSYSGSMKDIRKIREIDLLLKEVREVRLSLKGSSSKRMHVYQVSS